MVLVMRVGKDILTILLLGRRLRRKRRSFDLVRVVAYMIDNIDDIILFF